MSRNHRKSRLAKKLEYWTRQMSRTAKLLIMVLIVIVIVFVLIWIVPKLIQWAFPGLI